MSYHKPDPNIKVTLNIDGVSVTVPEGTRILEAARQANIKIPTLCDHPELCKRALCRICVVEADGRGKLIAACANDVWDDVNIVTNNLRLLNVRKTIMELILANHPQDCLSCVRNTDCELQKFALDLGVRSTPFDRCDETPSPEVIEKKIEEDTIVRDMVKCVKCGRCVEACQEVQTIRAINTSHRSHNFAISSPYRQTLQDSNCVFCGKCAEICPVGAIYEHDQTAQVWEALNNGKKNVIAQITPQDMLGETRSFTRALEKELNLDAGAVTVKKIVAALKLLGFNFVADAQIIADACYEGIQDTNTLPVITGNSDSVSLFVKNFYPDLANHYFDNNPRKYFADKVKSIYAAGANADERNVVSVSFVPCIAGKYSEKRNESDFALTPAELTRMIKLAGIDIAALPEADFDKLDLPKAAPGKSLTDPLIVHGYAEARKVMEDIRKGECKAKRVHINPKINNLIY